MFSRCKRLALCALCSSLALWLACAPASAGAGRVDGVSDQSLRTEWVGGSAAARADRIHYARMVIPWDVMAEPGGESLHFELLTAWLGDVKALGLIPDLAIAQAEAPVSESGGLLPRVPGSQALYQRYVGALLSYAASVGEPIAYLEAWNEPNNAGLGATGHPAARTAAEYMSSATDLCAAHSCTSIAGDFLDAEYRWAGHAEAHEGATGMGAAYEREYDSYLSPVNPPNWGFHPYASVKYETTEAIAEFRGALADPSDSIWFTEVGVYECKGGRQTGSGGERGEQEGGARYLEQLISSEPDVAHTFYYELRSPSAEQEEQCPHGEDTSLYNYTGQARGAARLIFRSASPLRSTATAAADGLPAAGQAGVDDVSEPFAGVGENLWQLWIPAP